MLVKNKLMSNDANLDAGKGKELQLIKKFYELFEYMVNFLE